MHQTTSSTAGKEGVQLTGWMRGWRLVVAPRRVKAVEIMPLVQCAENTFLLRRTWATRVAPERTSCKAESVMQSFNEKFWNDTAGLPLGYIRRMRESDVRPTQVFAISLPFPLLTQTPSHASIEVITEPALYIAWTQEPRTTFIPITRCLWVATSGARWSLPPGYRVELSHRTVYRRHLVCKREKGKKNRNACCRSSCATRTSAVWVSVSEIFDGDEPHTPRGCVAQAWGVGSAESDFLAMDCWPAFAAKK